MNLHEYQAKQLLNQYGISTLKSECVRNADQIQSAAQKIGGSSWVIKAQVHAGGRGKGGGIKIAQSLDSAVSIGKQMLGMNLVTPQTGKEGEKVHSLLLEQTANISKEFYLAMLVNRSEHCISLVVSEAGGMDIEETAQKFPEKIARVPIHPVTTLCPFQKRRCADILKLDKEPTKALFRLLDQLYTLFLNEDLALLEINPLTLTEEKNLIPLDAKIVLDSNAQFRHPHWKNYPSKEELKLPSAQAQLEGFSFVPLEGHIGCMVNGAGLAMATMDIIQLYGGQPANFLDVGGSADVQRIQTAFEFILKDQKVRGILINIFGGIVRCDLIAQGIIKAFENLKMQIPLVVRLEGNSVDRAKELLQKSGLNITSAQNLKSAAQKIISLTQSGK